MYENKILSADGAVKENNGMFVAVTLTAGSDAATATLRTATGGGGDKLIPTIKVAANTTVHLTFPGGVPFTACHLVVTGTSPEVGISYK